MQARTVIPLMTKMHLLAPALGSDADARDGVVMPSRIVPGKESDSGQADPARGPRGGLRRPPTSSR